MKFRDRVTNKTAIKLKKGPKKKGPKRSIEEISRSYIDKLFNGEVDPDEAPDDVDLAKVAMNLDRTGNEFDIRKIMAKSVDPVTGMPTNMKLPEGDFKEASSFFDFCSNFVSRDTRMPFSRQMWIMTSLFGEYCPKCSNPKWVKDIHNVPVDYRTQEMPEEMVFLKYGRCPKCKGTKSQFIKDGKMNMYSELDLEAGQRSGKSAVTTTGAAYVTHKYLKFPKLSSVCEGIQSSTPLTATFVGYRVTDAMDLLWQPITDIIDNSPWFQEYHEMLEEYGRKYNTEFFRMKDVYLSYFMKNLELYPAGPSKRALRGRTRFLTAIDELGWFPTEDEEDSEGRERASADGTYNALDRSLLTVRTEVEVLVNKGYDNFLPGIAINISSPSSQTDKIHRLVEENKNSPTVLALRLPTWEVNPRIPRTSSVIKKAYADNPAKAERDYGANPPLNALTFIDTIEAKRAFVGKNRGDLLVVDNEIDGQMYVGASLSAWNPILPTPASILSIDAGYSNNAFALMVAHLNAGAPAKRPFGSTEPVPPQIGKVIVDLLTEVQPQRGSKIHFNYIFRKTIREIIRKYNIRYVFADRWNSLAILHRIQEEFPAVKAVQYSVKYKDFVLARSFLLEGRCNVPELEIDYDEVRRVDNYPWGFAGRPMAHFMFQLATVRDKGNTVIKGDKYTDDLFRSFVLGVSRIADPKVSEELLKYTEAQQRSMQRLGVIATGRGSQMPLALPDHLTMNGQERQRVLAISAASANLDNHTAQPEPRRATVVHLGRSFR